MIFFQETPRILSNTVKYNYVNRVRDPEGNDSRQGGGVAIGITKSLVFRDLTSTVPEALQALELVFVQVVHEQFELYALNVYVNKYHEKKSLLPALQQWLLEIRSKKPDAILLVAGDFNCAVQPVQYLHNVSLDDDQPTFRRVVLRQVRESRTDWVLCSHDLTHETLHHWIPEASDHAVIECSLELPRSRPRASHLILPKGDVIFRMCKQAEEEAKTFDDFLDAISAQARSKQHLQKIRIKLKQKHEQKNTLEKFAELIDNQIRTTTSKQAFQLINRLSIVHPTKRDGGVMNCYLTGSDDRIVVGQENVLCSCLHQLQLISGEAHAVDVQQYHFPDLAPLQPEQVIDL